MPGLDVPVVGFDVPVPGLDVPELGVVVQEHGKITHVGHATVNTPPYVKVEFGWIPLEA